MGATAAKSQYDLSTYWGRVQHFARVTNPFTLLASRKQLMEAEQLVVDYAAGKRPDLYDQPDKVWDAKYCELHQLSAVPIVCV